jgi:hypothetical protein
MKNKINKKFQNDIVFDNGVRRALTMGEREQLRSYNRAWQQWSMDFEKNMRRKFSKGFPFNSDEGEQKGRQVAATSPPMMKPQFPCICSGCGTPQQSAQNPLQ